MNFEQILPAESLKKHVKYFWTLESEDGQGLERTYKTVPDGLPGLVFQQKMAYTDQNGIKLPQFFLYGQTTKSTNQQVAGGFKNLGVYFQPTAIKCIFGMDAKEFTDRNIDLSDFSNSFIMEQLLNENNTLNQVELLSEFFLSQVDQQKTVLKKVNFAIDEIKLGKSLHSIQSVLKISERTLERYFVQYIGISPKRYSKIIRFQSALGQLRLPKRLTDIAYQNNYFDQSHFIREFKEFTGTNPKEFVLHTNEQVANYPEWKA